MSLVWKTDIGPATKRLVLLALADAANDDGVCWPSIGTLAQKSGASRRRTEEVLAELDGDGVIDRERRFNSSNVYRICRDKLSPATPREDCTPREDMGEDPRDLRVQTREDVGTNPKGTVREPSLGAVAPTNGQSGLFEETPELTKSAKKPRALPSLRPLPEEWVPNAKAQDWAQQQQIDLGYETAQFRDHHDAKGSKMKDWDAAFRTWLRNSAKWRAERGGSTPGRTGYDMTRLNDQGQPVFYASGKKIVYQNGMELQA